MLVECRLPTFRRPALLARALRSLEQQTCPAWRAIVLDDSPDQEACAVVASFHDDRIAYQANPRSLGAAANLDLAFSPRPLLGGSHAFVLEDDNAIESRFIELGLKRLDQGDVRVLSFNQRCVRLSSGGAETLGGLLRQQDEEAIWDRDRLFLNAFLSVSLPNGGYFWRLGVPSPNLAVGPYITEPQLQECVRQCKVPPPIALCTDALSLWSMLPITQVRRLPVGNRRLSANLNQLSRAVVAALGPQRLIQLSELHPHTGLRAKVERILSELSLLSPVCRPWFRLDPPGAVRALLRYYLYRDQLHDALDAIA